MKMIYILRQHLLKHFHFTIVHCLEQELLIVWKKEEWAWFASWLLRLENLLSVEFRLQRSLNHPVRDTVHFSDRFKKCWCKLYRLNLLIYGHDLVTVHELRSTRLMRNIMLLRGGRVILLLLIGNAKRVVALVHEIFGFCWVPLVDVLYLDLVQC